MYAVIVYRARFSCEHSVTMSLMHSATIRSPLGMLTVTVNDTHLLSIDFVKSKTSNGKQSALLKKVIKELEEYFKGTRKKFTIPLKAHGTTFQKSVWNTMQKIDHGSSVSYAALAKAIKKPKSFRAVATACGKNPLPIVIPCHRVKSASGLGGYSGGIGKKMWLFTHEAGKKLQRSKK